MSLLRYLQPVNKLPTPDEAGLPPSVIQEVNQAMQDTLQAESTKGKKKKYTSFTAEERTSIGRFAAKHGNSEAVKKLHTNTSHKRRCTNSNKRLACGCGQNQGSQIAIIRFVICLQNSETQFFYYSINLSYSILFSGGLY